MLINVLEVNVDDLGFGGVYSLVKSVIINRPCNVKIDIAAIEKFSNPTNIEMLTNYGTEVHYIGYSGNKIFKQIMVYKNLRRLLKSKRYDVIHIHADVSNKLLVSALAARVSGISKIVLHSHAAGVDGNHRCEKRIVHYFCRPLLALVGTDFVACSDLAATWMYPFLDKENIIVIENGVDLKRFQFKENIRDEVRRDLGITDETVIGHVGRFAYQKNHDFIIEIADKVKADQMRCKFLLIGEGPDFMRIKKLINNRGLNDVVLLYGTSNSVERLFMAMDVFILPSRFEGLPIVGVEAQAAGLPVIFSDKVTRQAKLTDEVYFIGIENTDLETWEGIIHKCSELKLTRKDAYLALKKKHYSLEHTIESFRKLYVGG